LLFLYKISKMKIQFLSKVNKYKRFNFVPRYYDERKERLDSLVDKYSKEEETKEEDFDYRRKEAMRLSMSDTWGRGKDILQQKKTGNIRVILIILGILFLGYLVFKDKGENKNETIVHKID
jgi:hypothetical protein